MSADSLLFHELEGAAQITSKRRIAMDEVKRRFKAGAMTAQWEDQEPDLIGPEQIEALEKKEALLALEYMQAQAADQTDSAIQETGSFYVSIFSVDFSNL